MAKSCNLLFITVCLNADLGTLFATTDRETKDLVIERLEVFSSSDFSDCVSVDFAFQFYKLKA